MAEHQAKAHGVLIKTHSFFQKTLKDGPKDVHPPSHSAKDVNSLKKVKNILIFLKGFPSFGDLARRCAHLLGHLSTSFSVFPKGFGRRAMSTIGYPHCPDLVR